MIRSNKHNGFDLSGFDVPSQRKSLGDHVFDNLKNAIVRGDVASGNRLVESRIAEALNISRTPIREAIHKLEREGYLQKLPRGGFIVLGLSREGIEETFGIRSILESYAARLSALKHRKEELAPLQKKVEEYEACLLKNRLEPLTRINTEFHDLLYALSHSPKLNKMINDLGDQIYRFRQIILKDEKLARISNEDHKRMLLMIERREADGVERLVRAHILRGQAAVLKAFDENQFHEDFLA